MWLCLLLFFAALLRQKRTSWAEKENPFFAPILPSPHPLSDVQCTTNYHFAPETLPEQLVLWVGGKANELLTLHFQFMQLIFIYSGSLTLHWRIILVYWKIWSPGVFFFFILIDPPQAFSWWQGPTRTVCGSWSSLGITRVGSHFNTEIWIFLPANLLLHSLTIVMG